VALVFFGVAENRNMYYTCKTISSMMTHRNETTYLANQGLGALLQPDRIGTGALENPPG